MLDPAQNLMAYLVGGVVRDRLLGLPVKDRDWVVVGATPKEMLDRGFKPVGKDFPVFLHPETGEEYALARSERKVAAGYRGFEMCSDPTITLEQDLQRRDLTINAIAEDSAGRLIDPFGGIDDIKMRRIRHVSTAFSEDPVRILRAARFAARYQEWGFSIADETLGLMQAMVSSGEVDALVAERVWQEMEAVLQQGGMGVFIQVLRDCGALGRILPEIDRLFGVPQPKQYHPEVGTGLHILLCLQAVEQLTDDPAIRFAVLMHDLGKGVTPKDQWPSHVMHEKLGIPLVEEVCRRLRVPTQYRKLALKVCEFHLQCHRVETLKPKTILKLLEALDGFRNPQDVERFTLACMADKQGRAGYENSAYHQADFLLCCLQAAASIDIAPIVQQQNDGRKIKEAIRRARLAEIKHVKHANNANVSESACVQPTTK